MLVDHSERVFSPAGILLLVRAAKLARLLFFMEPSIPVRFLFLPIRSWSAFSPMVGAWKSRRRPCGWGGESRPGRRRGCTGLVQVHPNTLKTSGVTQHQDECPSFISCKMSLNGAFSAATVHYLYLPFCSTATVTYPACCLLRYSTFNQLSRYMIHVSISTALRFFSLCSRPIITPSVVRSFIHAINRILSRTVESRVLLSSLGLDSFVTN